MYDPNGTYGFNSINTVACKILNNKFLMNICLTSDCWKVPQDGGGGGIWRKWAESIFPHRLRPIGVHLTFSTNKHLKRRENV